jgi:hypothetical protein
MTRPVVVWDPRMLGYHHPGGRHPMNPLRWELTWQLAGALGDAGFLHLRGRLSRSSFGCEGIDRTSA